MGEGESSASREPRGPLTILPMPAPGCACGAHSRMGSRTAFRPPFLPALTGPLSRGWTVGPARVLASFRGITGSSEAGAGCCVRGEGPGAPCCAHSGQHPLLVDAQGALCPADGCRSSSTRRTAAWTCCLSTWRSHSAPWRKLALPSGHPSRVHTFLPLAHSLATSGQRTLGPVCSPAVDPERGPFLKARCGRGGTGPVPASWDLLGPALCQEHTLLLLWHLASPAVSPGARRPSLKGPAGLASIHSLTPAGTIWRPQTMGPRALRRASLWSSQWKI